MGGGGESGGGQVDIAVFALPFLGLGIFGDYYVGDRSPCGPCVNFC